MDPYATLGVTKTATQDEIKSAYRKLAKKLHPDLNPGNKKIEEQFKEVNKAYEMVGTPENRKKFDNGEMNEQFWQEQAQRHGRGGPFYYETQEPGGGRYSTNFEGIDPEIFESIFGGVGGMGFNGGPGTRGRRRRRGPARGEDQHYNMEVDFNTAILGGEREITLPTGKKLRVKIPAGVKSGTRLRLSGQGEPGEEGAASGDAYIEVTVLPSEIFRRVGNDIETEIPVPFDEAILGGEARVPTVDGAVMLKVPAGVSTGSKIRIRGKGVPVEGGGTRGDQYAVVKVTVPKDVGEDLKKSLQDWRRKHGAKENAV